MTDTTPAAELRAAAAKLRELASKATSGPWRAVELPPNEHHKHPAHWVKADYADGDNCVSSVVVADCPWGQADAELIAAMHPGVGAALADWLDSTAATIEAVLRKHEDAATEDSHWVAPALAAARALNGGQR